MVSGNPYHSPSEVAGGVRASTMTSFMPVLSKAEKSMRVTRAGMVSVCTFGCRLSDLGPKAYALRNFKADKVGAAHKAVLFDYGIRMVA